MEYIIIAGLAVIIFLYIQFRRDSSVELCTLSDDHVKWNVADEFQHLSPEEHQLIYSCVADKSAVACINLSGDSNIGVMIRTAAIFGIGEFYILGRRKYDRRSTVGTHHHIPLTRIHTMKQKKSDELDVYALTNILTKLQEKYKIVFVEQHPAAYPYTDLYERKLTGQLPENTLFVFGNESYGIPKELYNLPNVDCCVIPQYGIGRSLTVSVACGIILAEWKRLNVDA